MAQVLERRFRRWIEGDRDFGGLPDLILVDGGEVHAALARRVLEGLGLSVPVVGMVKDSHHRSRALYFRGEEFVLTERPLLFSFIGAIQEEVHRFAIEYQRGLRQKKLQKSQLEQIPGVGEKRRNALLLHYGSIEAIAAADAAEMAALPGMTREVAENIKKHFQNVIVKSNK